jgi:anthranilate/para-aminobenzoate synthase component I
MVLRASVEGGFMHVRAGAGIVYDPSRTIVC